MYSIQTTPKTPLSASKGRSYIHGRCSNLLTPSRRQFSPASATSMNLSMNRTFHLSVLEETGQHFLNPYGDPLPVLVTEAITEGVNSISVRLEESGWASLVCGRKLFIWKFKPEAQTKSFTRCRSLALPPSDLAHRAELVHVRVWNENQMPSALAVSPEGIIRYWHNIVQENLSVESTIELQGQECHSLTSVLPHGYILATTTSSLVLITPVIVDGQPVVRCRTLKIPQGMLAGLGRRVSSFIFGAIPAQTEAKLNKVLSAQGDKKGEHFLYVLSSCTLQKWLLSEDEPDQLLYEYDLDRCLKENFFKSFWSTSSTTQPHVVKNWCLDMQFTPDGIIILAAATNVHCSPTVVYAYATVNVSGDRPFTNFTYFYAMKYSEKYQVELEERLLSYKLLFPLRNSQYAYVYNSDKVVCVPVVENVCEQELMDAETYGHILGAGSIEGLPLIFTQMYSIISLRPSQQSFIDASFQMESLDTTDLFRASHPEDNKLASELKKALCLFFNNEYDKSLSMVNEMFPVTVVPENDSELDKNVILLSKQIIDDYPVSDPRWCESVPAGDSRSSSMIILHQLDEKLKVHDCLINFLKIHGLFGRLLAINHRNILVPTKVLLCEHAEKIIASKVLRRLLLEFNATLMPVIRETLAARKLEVKNNLTHQDVFFREVSAIDSLFEYLIKWEERQLADDNQEIVQKISLVNSFFVEVIQAVTQYRIEKCAIYDSPEKSQSGQYIPWTSDEGVGGLRTLLLKQHSINVQYMFKVTNAIQVQSALFKHIVEIIHFLLSGFESQLHSVSGTDLFQPLNARFERERNHLIQPLVDIGQHERALALAERYLDFDIIMQLCESTHNQELLQRYMLQFKAHGFSDYMFEWYLNKGMRDKLLVNPFIQQEELSQFLQGHSELSWLHHIKKQKYDQAHNALQELAFKETQFLSKKKTQLSLSKLALLASDLPEDAKSELVDGINHEQDLIIHQEHLPEPVVDALGLNIDSMRVLVADDLIEMYISEENTSASAFDFKIALELLQFLKKPPGDPEHESLRVHIWCKAILRDNWDELDTSNPWDAVRDTVFFQVIKLALTQGLDLSEFVVPIEDLLQSHELSGIAENPNFAFLLQAGYEQIFKSV